ncbi:MAG: hypothetical protein ACKVWV_09015 [Planctomycetota bacterium]
MTAVGVMVSRQTQSTPTDFFRTVQQKIAEGRYDKEQTLANLDIALEGALGGHDKGLEGEIRVTRGRLLLGLGAFERARTDLERVLELRAGDRGIERLLVEIDVRAGNFNAGIGRVEKMRAADPAWTEGTALLGDLHRRAAARALNAAYEVLDKSLVTDESERAKALLARSAGWDPDDPRRVALLHDLRPFFSTSAEIDYDRAREASLSASEHMASARTILAQSLSESFDPNAFLSLLDLLKRADQSDAAADLCAAALRIPRVAEYEPAYSFLMRELARTGRSRYAAELATLWTSTRTGGSPDLLLDMCRALYRENRGRPLEIAAKRLKAAGDPSADFFIGVAQVAAGESTEGRFALQRFLSAQVRPPLPDAVAIAWREIAHACRDSSPPDMVAEREALEGAVAADPNGDGMAWLRLARLQYGSARGGLVQPGLRWARGMSLLPKQTEALMPTWRELGERELLASGVDVAVVRQAISDGRAWAPIEDGSPYELFTLAELYKDAGHLETAAQYCRRLRLLVPEFLPALEMHFELAQALGNPREAIALYLKRLQLVGPDEKGDEFLRLIPLDSLTHDDLLTLMRDDPDHAGRFYVARTLAQRGERLRALAILERVGVESLGRDAIRLAAKLHLELGRPERALELLVPIARSALRPPADTLDTFLEAALGARDHERIEQMAQSLARARDVDPKTWLALIDRMLAGGSAAAAQTLLARLDANTATRGGEVVLRAAVAALLLEQPRAVAELLERADAFESGGRTELVALLAASDDGDEEETPRAAAALRLSALPTTPLVSAWIALIAGRPEEAQSLIEVGLKLEERSPLWQLAAAEAARQKSEPWLPPAYFGTRAESETRRFLIGPDGSRDPRRTLCAVLALQHPLTIGWAQKELEAMTRESHGDVWPTLLTSYACQANQEWGRARDAAARLCDSAPDFGPGWDQRDRIASELPYEPRVRLLLRLDRMEALGEMSGTLAERLYDEACQYQLRGDIAPALAAARAAADVEPENGEIQRKLGQLYTTRGELTAAIGAYSRACRLSASGSDLASTGELLGVLERAHRATPPAIDRAAELALLDEIAAEQPDDPRIAVALARLDVDLSAPNLPLGLSRAYARLARFRTAHPGRSIESLARGAAKSWAEFLLAVDPGEAESFVHSELNAQPGDLDLWVLSGRVFAAQQKIDQALVPFEFALALAPDHAILPEYAWLKVCREVKPEEMRGMLTKIGMGDKSMLTPEDLALVKARFSYTSGGRYMALALDALKDVDTTRLSADQWRRYGLLQALALVARGKEEDLSRVGPALDAATPYLTQAWQRDVALALRGLAKQGAPQPAR